MSAELHDAVSASAAAPGTMHQPTGPRGLPRQPNNDRIRGDAGDILRLQRHGVIVVAASDLAQDLVARLVASLRHSANGEADQVPTDASLLSFDGWTLDLVERRLAAPDGTAAYLPGTEFALLRVFLEHPHRVLRRDDLAQLARSHGKPFRSTRTIDSYVSRLRRRLTHGKRAPLIATVWGAGYVLNADVARTSDADDA